eukprot:scaffold20_cov361-Prasinococcus_capsulatus_cf.AAC.2
MLAKYDKSLAQAKEFMLMRRPALRAPPGLLVADSRDMPTGMPRDPRVWILVRVSLLEGYKVNVMPGLAVARSISLSQSLVCAPPSNKQTRAL